MGISTNPVITTIEGTQGNGAGHMKVNKQFNKMAIGNVFDRSIELFDFDNATGAVSTPIIWNTPNPYLVYGIEFPPDGSKLYTLTVDFSTVYQYDIFSNASIHYINIGLRPNYFYANVRITYTSC